MVVEVLIVVIGVSVVTALAANARGRNPAAWFVIGLLTGGFGLVAVLVMERIHTTPPAAQHRSHGLRHAPADAFAAKRAKERAELKQAQAAEADTKPCPDCAERVKLEAKICRFCRHEFEPAHG
jgi:hypothetical protein